MNWQKWFFCPLDTCFFRGPLPFNAGEGGYTTAGNVFPPPVSALQGAIRTSLAVERGWRPGEKDKWPLELGGADDLGSLELRGPYLMYNGRCLYPMPLHIMEKSGNYFRVAPGRPVECDLGRVRLPVLPPGAAGADTAAKKLVNIDGLEKILAGGVPANDREGSDVLDSDLLWGYEERTGIEREDAARTAKEGHIYYSTHVRPVAGLKIAVFVGGVPDEWRPAPKRLLPLGGEGRIAAVEIAGGDPGEILPAAPRLRRGGDGKLRFTVTLLTPGFYAGNSGAEGVRRVIRCGPPGVPGECVSACVGRVEQAGGWDLFKKSPRPLEPVVPAGSTWFYVAESGEEERIMALHGACTGHRAVYGCGQLVIGTWEEVD